MAGSAQLGSTVSQDTGNKSGGLSLARIAVIATLLAYAALALFQLGKADLETDEGRYGISALNILYDYHQIAIVSPEPGGVPWSTWPYMYPVELAGSILLLGKTEFALRVVNVLLMLLTAVCIYRLSMLLLKDRTTALLASGLFLLNPATIAYARSAQAEPSVVFWGCAAMVAAASYRESGRPSYAALSGIALGLGFLAKLWLILPFGAAVALLLLARLPQGSLSSTIRDIAIGLVAFLIVAGSHLLLLRLLSPENLKIWLGTYFQSAASTRVGGMGYDPNMWYKPWWFYFGALFKGVFFGLPLLFLGTADLIRRRRYLVLGCAAWLVGPAFVLSLFKVKEAAYVSQAYPALAILIACGVLSFLETPQPLQVAFSVLASIALGIFFFAVGVVTRMQFLMMLALYVLYLAAAPMKLILPRWRKLAAVAAALATLLLTDAVVMKRQLSRRTHYREIASYFRPRVGPLQPGTVIFTSPEFAALGFYLFRQGEYWDTFYFHKDDAQFRNELEHGDRLFYVVDPSGILYGGKIKPEWGALLAQNTRDVTAEIEQATRTRIGLRVLVPLAQPATMNHDQP
ncbi:MAG: ArnT family glycosyltransferase [Candidatus Korobacteraceae bacterium]